MAGEKVGVHRNHVGEILILKIEHLFHLESSTNKGFC